MAAVDLSFDTYYSVPTGRRYPVGKDVLVHYNPKFPAETVLEPGPKLPNLFIIITLGVGIFIMVLSIMVLLDFIVVDERVG